MATTLAVSRRLAKLALSSTSKYHQQNNGSSLLRPSVLSGKSIILGSAGTAASESGCVGPNHRLLLSGVRFQSGGKGDEDPFGLDYKDSKDMSNGNIGEDHHHHPPLYTRDEATGKFTGEIEPELKDEDRDLLHLSQVDKERALTSRLLSSVLNSNDGAAPNKQLSHAAQRIREEAMALNVLGRKVSDIIIESSSAAAADSDDGVSAPLSIEEVKSLKSFLEQEHGLQEAQNLLERETLIARQSTQTNRQAETTNMDSDNDDVDTSNTVTSTNSNPDLDLTWMTAAAQNELESLGYLNTPSSSTDTTADDPFANLMPSDLNPARKVNRRRAQPIPKSLLHHNNLSLLRRYVTPGGQIMNRVQSRLSAKDQRKISKLIKRARHLGLIPYMGQWKMEDTGNIHEEHLLNQDLDWEKELLDRGILQRSSPIWKKAQEIQSNHSHSSTKE